MKKRFAKITAVLLVLSMVFSLAACSGSETTGSNAETTAPIENETTAPVKDETTAPEPAGPEHNLSAPNLELKIEDVTLHPGTYSFDLYSYVKNKEKFDPTLFECISEDESLVRTEGTMVYGIGNTTKGVKVTLIYGQQQVTCKVRVRGIEPDNGNIGNGTTSRPNDDSTQPETTETEPTELNPTEPELNEPTKPASEGLEFKLNSDRESYSVVGIGTCTDTDIVIPAAYNGLPVTGIGASAFRGIHSMTSIVIPVGVTNIDNYAFVWCSNLTNIEISNSVARIGEGAFIDTAYYRNDANWENGVLYIGNNLIEANSNVVSGAYVIREGTKCIASKAFKYCHSLTSITIPDSVTSIDKFTFWNCSTLRSVEIPDSVESIGGWAFEDCSSLTSVKIPNSVASIGDYAFHKCKSLKNLTFKKNSKLTGIGSNAFYGCSSLTSITIPNSVASIGGCAFRNCSSLTSITIPNSVTSIGRDVFSACKGLTNITVESGNAVYHSTGNCIIETASKTLIAGCKTSVIPTDGSVTIIDNYAFSGCSRLTRIVIPKSVTSIGDFAFYGCSSLTDINFNGTMEQWNAIKKNSDWDRNTGSYVIHCTDGNIAK